MALRLIVCSVLAAASASILGVTVPIASIPVSADDCAVPRAFLHLARTSGISVGVETTGIECWSRHTALHATTMNDATVGTVADRLIQVDARYGWQVLKNVLVIRPRVAWPDRSSFMERAVSGFDVTLDNVDVALVQLSRAFRQRSLRPNPSVQDLQRWQDAFDVQPHSGLDPSNLLGWHRTSSRQPWHVHFSGGSLLEALSALVAAPAGGAWSLTYCADRRDEEHAVLVVVVRDNASQSERAFTLADNGDGLCDFGER